jgi:hypothetical protein
MLSQHTMPTFVDMGIQTSACDTCLNLHAGCTMTAAHHITNTVYQSACCTLQVAFLSLSDNSSVLVLLPAYACNASAARQRLITADCRCQHSCCEN